MVPQTRTNSLSLKFPVSKLCVASGIRGRISRIQMDTLSLPELGNVSRLMNCKSATQMKPHARYKHSPLRWACCHRQRGRKSEREGVHTHMCDGSIMDASSPPDSLGYVRMTNSLRNNSFDWFAEERKLVMLPRIKLLLGLVLNFIK